MQGVKSVSFFTFSPEAHFYDRKIARRCHSKLFDLFVTNCTLAFARNLELNSPTFNIIFILFKAAFKTKFEFGMVGFIMGVLVSV